MMSERSGQSAGFMKALLEQTLEERREASRRAATHIRVYISIAAALVAVLVALLNQEVELSILLWSACALLAILGTIGFVTFARFIAINGQTALLTANISRYCHYFLDSDPDLAPYFGGTMQMWPSTQWESYPPFSPQVTRMLWVFVGLNALILAVGVASAAAALALPGETGFCYSNMPCLLTGIVSFLAAAAVHGIMLGKRIQSAKDEVKNRMGVGGSGTERIAQQLRRYVHDLRDAGDTMRVHARTTMPEGLNENQTARLEAERRELLATADAALKLAIQTEGWESNVRRRTLTRADMESLGVESDALAGRINQRMARARTRESTSSGGLNETTKDAESMQETVRNRRQMASTAFQNFDQKANQLYNLLSLIMKAMNATRMATIRNML